MAFTTQARAQAPVDDGLVCGDGRLINIDNPAPAGYGASRFLAEYGIWLSRIDAHATGLRATIVERPTTTADTDAACFRARLDARLAAASLAPGQMSALSLDVTRMADAIDAVRADDLCAHISWNAAALDAASDHQLAVCAAWVLEDARAEWPHSQLDRSPAIGRLNGRVVGDHSVTQPHAGAVPAHTWDLRDTAMPQELGRQLAHVLAGTVLHRYYFPGRPVASATAGVTPLVPSGAAGCQVSADALIDDDYVRAIPPPELFEAFDQHPLLDEISWPVEGSPAPVGARFAWLGSTMTTCANANYYIAPDGELFVRPSPPAPAAADDGAGHAAPVPPPATLPWPFAGDITHLDASQTICVDIYDVPDEALTVELRDRGRVVWLRLWPGTPMTIQAANDAFERFSHASGSTLSGELFTGGHDGNVVTLTVHARPDGAAFTRLAVHNGVLGDLISSSGDVSTMAGFAMDRHRLEEQRRLGELEEARAERRGTLATAIRADSGVSSALTAIRETTPTEGHSLDQARLNRAWAQLASRIEELAWAFATRGVLETNVVETLWAEAPFPVSPPTSPAAGISTVDAWLANLAVHTTTVPADEATRAAKSDRLVEALCELAGRPVRMVTHQLLLQGSDSADRRPSILSLDFETGILDGETLPDPYRADTALYLAVSRVPGDRSLRVELDGTEILPSSEPLVGAPEDDATPSQDHHRGRARVSDDSTAAEWRRQVSLPGTVVIRVPPLSGAHEYSIVVCERAGLVGPASCSESAEHPARTVIEGGLRVAGRHTFGIRAGIGAAITFDSPERTLQRCQEASCAHPWTVGTVGTTAAVSVPVVLVAYLLDGGRDVYGYDGGFAFNMGPTLGIDATAPHERWYPIGWMFDFAGVGVWGSLMMQRVGVVRLAPGQYDDPRAMDEQADALPLSALASSSDQLALGVAFGLTVDFDLFQRLIMYAVDDDKGLGSLTGQ